MENRMVQHEKKLRLFICVCKGDALRMNEKKEGGNGRRKDVRKPYCEKGDDCINRKMKKLIGVVCVHGRYIR